MVLFTKFSEVYARIQDESVSSLQNGAPFFMKVTSKDVSQIITSRDEYDRAIEALRDSSPKVKFSELKYWPLFELWLLTTVEPLLSTSPSPLSDDALIGKLLKCGDADNEGSASRFALLFAEGVKLYFKKNIYEDKRTQGLKMFAEINKQYMLNVENFRESFVADFFKGFSSMSIDELIVDLKLMSLYSPKLEPVFRNIVLVSLPKEHENAIYLRYNYNNADGLTVWDDIYDQSSLKNLLKELSNNVLQDNNNSNSNSFNSNIKRPDSVASSTSISTAATTGKKTTKIPKNYQDITNTAEPEKWRTVCINEIKSVQSEDIFEVVRKENIKDEAKIVASFWKFEMEKTKPTASIQTRDNYEHVEVACSSTHSGKSQRYLLAKAVHQSLELRKLRFPNGKREARLDHCVYMKPPAGCGNSKEDLWRVVSRFSKFKSPQMLFYLTCSRILTKVGFVSSTTENCLLVNQEKNIYVVICEYEALVAAPNLSSFQHIIETLSEGLQVIDCGTPESFQRLDIRRRPNGDIELNLATFIESIKREYHITMPPNKYDTPLPPDFNINDESTRVLAKSDAYKFKRLLSDLREISRSVRLDCYYEVNLLHSYPQRPRDLHMSAVTRIFNYLYLTRNESLRFSKERQIKINLEEVPHEEMDPLTKTDPLVVKYQLKSSTHSSDRLRELQRVGSVTLFATNIIDWDHARVGSSNSNVATTIREKKDLALHLRNLFKTAK